MAIRSASGGTPISKPKGFRTVKVTAGFNLNYSFWT